MCKFLIDESTGQAVVRHLRRKGYDVVGVAEVMPQADDDNVIEHAFQEQRVLITNDKDFGEKVFRDAHPHAGVLLLRLSDDRASHKSRITEAVLRKYLDRLPDNFVVATEETVRIRKSAP